MFHWLTRTATIMRRTLPSSWSSIRPRTNSSVSMRRKSCRPKAPVRPSRPIRAASTAYAIAHGLQFTIGDVLPPTFVNDIPRLQVDSLNPNVRFVKEDVNYDASDLAHTLFRVAGYDVNNFYDPRFLFNQGNFTQLAIN